MKKGFTLMELIIVVIIIGILAMIGLPQFFNVAERGRSSEAASILGAIRSAQLRYYAEHSAMTSNCTDLDVEIGNLRYFNAPVCTSATKNGFLASMASQAGNYTLSIYDNASGLCCSTGTCPKGYKGC
ncbi:MAG: prepilin-type N-terminal cleavage/methylation domain-containing protein [Candidatus Omnitrophota bacterium]